jgi:hypothetical protein
MKQYRRPIVLKISILSGGRFDILESRVHPFGERIGDPVNEVVEHTVHMLIYWSVKILHVCLCIKNIVSYNQNTLQYPVNTFDVP